MSRSTLLVKIDICENLIRGVPKQQYIDQGYSEEELNLMLARYQKYGRKALRASRVQEYRSIHVEGRENQSAC